MASKALETLSCPNCNGEVELDDEQEYGFCKYCGAKVQNTNFKKVKVKIEGNPTIQNYIKLAERDYNDENYEEALGKYNKVLDIDPDNWKAVYRRGVCITKTTTLRDFRIEDIVKGSKNALKILEKDKEMQKELDQIKMDMAYDIVMACFSLYTFAFKHYWKYWELKNSAPEMWNRSVRILTAEIYSTELVESLPENIKATMSLESRDAILQAIYKHIILNCITLCESRSFKNENMVVKTWVKNEDRAVYVTIYDKFVEKLKKLDPNAEIKPIARTVQTGGCYVATCVYGSYDCPQVWTLRRYRDQDLASTWYGRLFIHTYYAISPTLVKYFGQTGWFKKIWKTKLDNMVERLNKEGYASTQYNDRDWK